MERKTTLVVVDFQYDFCLLGAPLYVPGSNRALWNISDLIENKKVDRVIFTADWHPANHCSFKRNGGEWDDHCIQFSKGAAIHDLLLYGCISSGVPYRVLITEKGWGDGETGPQIPKKCMGEAIKLVKAKLANVDGKLLADTIKTYLV